MDSSTLHLELEFHKGYIAEPYWPARAKLIDIQKESGMNRARSADKRVKTLAAWLDANGQTMDGYRELERLAARPFYTRDDGEIVIPAHQLHGMLAQACDVAPASVRLCRADQVRTLLSCEDFRTGRHQADGCWERFVTVKSGTGQTLSNQRGLRSSPYIEHFTATGTVTLRDPEMASKVERFFGWAGLDVGVGASRKMGWGRFLTPATRVLNARNAPAAAAAPAQVAAAGR